MPANPADGMRYATIATVMIAAMLGFLSVANGLRAYRAKLLSQTASAEPQFERYG